MTDNNRVLIVMDVSNFEYMTIVAAVNKWKSECKDEADAILKDPDETDQNNLPDLINYQSYRRILNLTVQRKLESVMWIARNNHQQELDIADGIDVILTEDSDISNNFRKVKYPEYKAQRKLRKSQFKMYTAKNYVQNVIFKELGVEDRMGYRIVRVPDCESDDIIAVTMKRFPEYMCRILISSDRDFLQLENVNQYNMWGEKIERNIKNVAENMSTTDFLLWKIIRGDVSDNIKNVFPGVGEKKAYLLVNDRPRLKKLLTEDRDAAQRFILNKTLIDFRSIPSEMEDRIYSVVKEKLESSFKTNTFNLADSGLNF